MRRMEGDREQWPRLKGMSAEIRRTDEYSEVLCGEQEKESVKWKRLPTFSLGLFSGR
jgi:hypothetical protein